MDIFKNQLCAQTEIPDFRPDSWQQLFSFLAMTLQKEVKTEGGVYQIKNLHNDKIYIGSTPNIKTLNGVKFTLKTNTHQNKELQKEWNTYGADAFSIEMLETIKREEEKALSKKDLLKLEAKWLEKLQPYGEKGYHSPKADTKEK